MSETAEVTLRASRTIIEVTRCR